MISRPIINNGGYRITSCISFTTLIKSSTIHHFQTCYNYSSSSNNKSQQGVMPKSVAKNIGSQWLKRQLTDPFVKMAKVQNYVSRAAFKLEEIDDKYKLFRESSVVIDLGATPGGWTQVAQRRVGNMGLVISVDINGDSFSLNLDDPMTNFICGDFRQLETKQKIKELLLLKKTLPPTTTSFNLVDVVVSDMAPSYCGVQNMDHDRLMYLATEAYLFSLDTLKKGGSFLCKVSRGGSEKEFITKLGSSFKVVKSIKPDASRQQSTEIYYLALNYNGVNNNNNNNGNNSTPNQAPSQKKKSIYDDDD